MSDRPLEDHIDDDAPARAAFRIASAGGDDLERRTQRHTPIGKPDPNRPARLPGTARASVHRTPVEVVESVRGRLYRVLVRTFDPVFPFIEWDTKPHDIEPRPDRAPATVVATRRPRGTVQDGRAALSWLEIGGRRVYARKVRHPGTRGVHPFALAALEMDNTVAVTRVAQPALREFERELVRTT